MSMRSLKFCTSQGNLCLHRLAMPAIGIVQLLTNSPPTGLNVHELLDGLVAGGQLFASQNELASLSNLLHRLKKIDAVRLLPGQRYVIGHPTQIIWT